MKSYDHQVKVLEQITGETYAALFLEQGLGKSRIIIQEVENQDKIAGALVVTKNGVHANWGLIEIPKHGGLRFHSTFIWRSGKTSVDYMKAWRHILQPTNRMLERRWLLMNIEALRTPKGRLAAEGFLKSGPMMFVVDESTVIKNPKAQQTKACLKLAPLATYRRILTGTPVTQGPLDLFSQCKFLHPKALPWTSYTAFKAMFAITERKTLGHRTFEQITGYRNLPVLEESLKPFAIRLEKKDCLDLPEKIYRQYAVEPTDQQTKVYKELRDQRVSLLEEQEGADGVVTAASVLSALIKLREVCLGFVLDDEGGYRELACNRPEQLLNLVGDPPEKTIVWFPFVKALQRVEGILRKKFGPRSCAVYYGDVPQDERNNWVTLFQSDPEVKFFLATSAASMGLTLTAAANVVYYGNDYSLQNRLQSEDRVHRIGQDRVCVYTDMFTPETVEESILKVLKMKQGLSTQVITSDWRKLLGV